MSPQRHCKSINSNARLSVSPMHRPTSSGTTLSSASRRVLMNPLPASRSTPTQKVPSITKVGMQQAADQGIPAGTQGGDLYDNKSHNENGRKTRSHVYHYFQVSFTLLDDARKSGLNLGPIGFSVWLLCNRHHTLKWSSMTALKFRCTRTNACTARA